MKEFSYQKVSGAMVDTHRSMRCGFPEVIFCQGKAPEDIRRIALTILKHNDCLLATRADARAYRAIKSIARDAQYHPKARIVRVDRRKKSEVSPSRDGGYQSRKSGFRPRASGFILIVTGGTADIPVAEEARITAEMMGQTTKTLYDVGVAGIHRVLDHHHLLKEARVIIVVAGMDGALASVVGGLVAQPVIAVPTSVGYGAHFNGLAPLLTMLNSCAAGIGVVNIDNGFGAGYLAALINRNPSY